MTKEGITVCVNDSHIIHGTPRCSDGCPIALAVAAQRPLGMGEEIEVCDGLIRIWQRRDYVLGHPAQVVAAYRLPLSAADWMDEYDQQEYACSDGDCGGVGECDICQDAGWRDAEPITFFAERLR